MRVIGWIVIGTILLVLGQTVYRQSKEIRYLREDLSEAEHRLDMLDGRLQGTRDWLGWVGEDLDNVQDAVHMPDPKHERAQRRATAEQMRKHEDEEWWKEAKAHANRFEERSQR
jgi:hypothetical protein